MKEKITQEEIQYLATLSRVGLTQKEVTKYQQEISKILEYFEKLKSLDTSSVIPMSQATGLVDVARVDKILGSGISREDLLKNTPVKENGYIKVKSIFNK